MIIEICAQPPKPPPGLHRHLKRIIRSLSVVEVPGGMENYWYNRDVQDIQDEIRFFKTKFGMVKLDKIKKGCLLDSLACTEGGT